MDWMIFGVMASVAAVFFLWKVHSTKREAELFADQVEKALDDILSGREVDFPDVSEDTLWGKVSEKLGRTEKIWKQKEEKSKSEKEKMKELIGDISHQTKTPIANMKIYLELLEDEEVSPKARAFAAQIGRQTDKLEFLVQSMIRTAGRFRNSYGFVSGGHGSMGTGFCRYVDGGILCHVDVCSI